MSAKPSAEGHYDVRTDEGGDIYTHTVAVWARPIKGHCDVRGARHL